MKNPDLNLDSYDFELDKSFIASRPVEGRHNSKLLVYNASTDKVTHTHFYNIGDFLPSESLLVLNKSKVFPCRLLGNKKTGGKIEVFFLSLIASNKLYPAFVKSRGKKKVGEEFIFDDLIVTIKDILNDGSFLVSVNLSHDEFINFLEEKAKIPIPPYIRDGVSDDRDLEDYQTTYADELGSVAAPTAGLHFTNEVFNSLEIKNINKAFVTLHVGAGTFKPVTCENILEHEMHSEFFNIEKQDLDSLNSAKKIFAVGTTSLRVLESTYNDGKHKLVGEYPFSTNLFLYPGKEVKSIDGLITNFHLPKSSLIMLVSSLIGREKTLELYEIAKNNNYRFFSYGDAMLIIR